MKEVKFKMGKYSDLVKLFNDGKLEDDTIYMTKNKESYGQDK